MIKSLHAPARPLAAAFLLLLATGCRPAPQEPQAMVEAAWIRLPAVPGQPAAGYFTATATTAGEEIITVTSPAAKVEMHETVSNGGMSAMRPLAKAAFAGSDPIRFEPGGKHLMLFGLDPKLRPGTKILLSFRFKTAPPATVEAELKALGDGAPEHAGH